MAHYWVNDGSFVKWMNDYTQACWYSFKVADVCAYRTFLHASTQRRLMYITFCMCVCRYQHEIICACVFLCVFFLTSWVQQGTPVERLFSRGRRRSRTERGWDLSSPSFSSSFLSDSGRGEQKVTERKAEERKKRREKERRLRQTSSKEVFIRFTVIAKTHYTREAK